MILKTEKVKGKRSNSKLITYMLVKNGDNILNHNLKIKIYNHKELNQIINIIRTKYKRIRRN